MSGDPNTKGEASADEDDEDEEDHATVVLDLNKLKEEMEKKNDLSSAAEDLEFAVGPEDGEEKASESGVPSFKVIMFEFGKPLFEASQDKMPSGFEYMISKDVKDLSAKLKSTDFQVVMFFYNGDPKAVNTLCAQVKSKFPKTKTIIVAQNLSPDKVKMHQNSASGANEYITLPLEEDKVRSTLEKIYKDHN